jgi:hypothetical protein
MTCRPLVLSCRLPLFLLLAFSLRADNPPASLPLDLPEFHWHLTARPWQPVNAPKSELLDQMDKAMHAMAPLQYWNENDPGNKTNGAIIDPFDKKEIQYGTPLFAFNVATLMTEGRSADLLTPGVRALDRATLNISTGFANDGHGEFFCAPMVKAIRMYEALQSKYPEVITPERLNTWKERMKAGRTAFMYLKVRQNWRTFAMKGEWLRQADGYITDGVNWIEMDWTNWDEGDQRGRFRQDLDKYHMNPCSFLYHDNRPNPPGSSRGSPTYSGADPETFTYNGATTANLLDMLENGYDGASANEMRDIISHNLRSSLLLMSASGEAPAGGRTGEHIWDDTIYANAFELMAQVEQRKGDLRVAGEFQHAVQLLLKSHARFQQENGWFSITKNLFPPGLKNHYATWSGVANYEGLTLGCCSETLIADKTNIVEQPTPGEIGGYAVKLDPSFANVFLDAGGMQAQICTRGETDNYGLVQWHTLGITRFSRVGWDGRLGPDAGSVNNNFSDGVSFSPVFLEDGKWTRVCLEPKRFEGSFKAEFVHPLLVRGTYTIAPVGTNTGPTFAMHLTLTPDGALVDTERVSGINKFGVLWPLFEFDGRNVLNTSVGSSIAATAYPRMAGTASVIQAGQATASGGAAIASDQPGYHGEGFARFAARGAALEWSGLDGGDGGATAIGFRYALGLDKKMTRRAKLTVNGVVQPDLVFLSTGDWKFWHQLYVPVTLARGTNNTVRIESDDEGGEIIDELRVHPAVPSASEPDQENFIALKSTHQLDASSPTVRGGYGDFCPVRVTDSKGGAVETFVYPRNVGDPDAESVRTSFVRKGQDFSSVLGRMKGTLYVGRTSAGGEGKGIDLDNDGKNDVTFDQTCAFILQLKNGRPITMEADRSVTATIRGKQLKLAPFTPVTVN